MDMVFSYYSSAREPEVLTLGGMTLLECGEILQIYSQCPCPRDGKLDWFGLTPAHVEGARRNANVRAIFGICADIDIGPDDVRYRTFEEMTGWLRSEEIGFVAHTTTKSQPHHHRFRLMFSYAEAIPPARHQAAWHAVNEKLNGVIDAGTKDPSRISLFPANWEGNYTCLRTKQVTVFETGYSAFDMAEGRPILSISELQALPHEAPKPIASKVSRVVRSQDSSLNAAPLAKLEAHSGQCEGALRAVLVDWDRSPYLTASIKRIAGEPGQRDYRFLCSVALRAMSRGMPINEGLLTDLGEVFSYRGLLRPPPDDLQRQVRNALEFAASHAANPPHQDDGLSQ